MNNFAVKFNFWTNRVLLSLVIIELFLFPELITIFGCFYCLFGWYIISSVVISTTNFLSFPISSFMLLGYGICSFLLPIPATLLDGNPITYRLIIPEMVFFHGVLTVLIVVLAYLTYVQLNQNISNETILRKLLKFAKIYDTPTDLQIWIMGFFGIVTQLYTFINGNNISENVSSTDKFLDGFSLLAYAPYYLIFKNIYSRFKPSTLTRPQILIYLFYSVAILVIALMSNHRATFMKAIMGVGFVYLLGLFMGRFSRNVLSRRNIIIGGILIFFLTGPLANLGTAMVIVRSQKKSLTSSELVEKTLETYFDNNAITRYQEIFKGRVIPNPLWNEHYVSNIFLGRLSNLKAVDLSLQHAERVKNTERMRDFFFKQIVSLLPSPILSYLDLKIDKAFVTKASYGDYLYYLSSGDYHGLESKRQAQLSGAGMSAFGYFYLVVLFLVLIPLFGLLDLLTFKQNGLMFISITALTSISSFFTFFNHEGISTFVLFSLRGWIQLVALYFFVFVITKPFSRLLNRFMS